VIVFQHDMLKDRAIFLTGGGTASAVPWRCISPCSVRACSWSSPRTTLKDVSDEIRRGGGSAAFATCDVRDYGAVETAAILPMSNSPHRHAHQ